MIRAGMPGEPVTTTTYPAPLPEDECRWCDRRIVLMDGSWTDPEATGDAAIWRQVCDANQATFTGEHDPS